MRNVEQARALAIERLVTGECAGFPAVLIDSRTEESAAGWVYHYQSAACLQSQESQDSLVGNAPLFVPRDGSAAVFISYHRPTSESVNAFLCCGDANAMPNAEVELSGWAAGALAVSAIKTICAFSSLGLFEAKTVVEACLAGEAPRVRTREVAAARELAAALNELHFVATVTYGAAPET